MTTIILALFIATLIAVLVAPLIIKLYRHFGWDHPRENRLQQFKNTHHGHIPRGGGIVIFISIFLTSLILLTIDQQLGYILLGAAILMITGFLDDILDLSPILRLVINLVVAGIVIYAGITITYVTNPFAAGVLDFTHLPLLTIGLTLVYIVGLMNITNWSKGVDGQLPGVAFLAAVFIGLLSLRLTNGASEVILLSFIVAGSFLGFLYWNFYPQRMMPGYGGGTLAGYFLAVLSILSGAKLATLFMVLALPIADATFTIARRLIAGKSPFWGDRGHLHHKLLDKLGWSRRRIAIFYWAVTLIMGILALILPTWGKIIAFGLVMILTFYFLIWVKFNR